MATKYVLVTLFIIILLPCSFAGIQLPKTGGLGRGRKIRNSLLDIADLIGDFLPPVTGKTNQTTQSNSSIKYRSITYPYINITNMYYIDVMIGTGAVPYADFILDMSSDLIWTNCNSTKSATSLVIPCPKVCSSLVGNLECPKECSYNFTYDQQDSTQVAVARDKFTLGNQVLPDIVFGCGTQNEGLFNNASDIPGIIGLGMGNLSLISQMNYENFSYCLNSNSSEISPLFLNVSHPNMKGNQVHSTPLIQSPGITSGYYVGLMGISVDDKPLQIPSTTFSLLPDGSGGVVMDFGFFLTYLQKEGYEQVKQALVSNVSLSQKNASAIEFDLCFSISDPNQLPILPTITLHFDGGADMVLDPYNYMLLYEDHDDNLLCLAILPTDGTSYLGYLLQEDKHIVYDLKNSMLYFQAADCGTSMNQLIPISGSDLSFQVGVGFYFQVLVVFMFQILVGF
ncbi:aspartic proteinase nepenthesin-1-like [Typha angustifolia]|uniref:aspartic proteinase nepenthesin-1-like n=1 Tax=Typha angustifolia TaxID=59011 RepID=UPI003C2B1915